MDSSEKSTHSILWVIGIAVVASLVIMGSVLFALLGSGAQQTDSNNSNESNVATTNEVEEDIMELDASIDQLETDNEAAKSAADDSKNQTKLGS